MKIKSRFNYRNLRIRWKFVILLFFILSFSTIITPALIDKDYYKNVITSEIRKSSPYEIEFSDTDFILFPLPGLEIRNLKLKNNGVEFFQSEDVTLILKLESLLTKKEIQFRSLEITNSKLLFHINKKGENNVFKNSESNSNQDIDIDSILLKLPKIITLNNLNLHYIDEIHSENINANISKFKTKIVHSQRLVEIDFNINVNQSNINSKGIVYFEKNEISYESIRWNLKVNLEEFSLYLAKGILLMFTNADFSPSIINANVQFHKLDHDKIEIIPTARIRQFKLKNQKSFGDIEAYTKITYSSLYQKLFFDQIQLIEKGGTNVIGNGYVTFTEKPIIYFYAKTSTAKLPLLTDAIFIWTEVDLYKSPYLKNLPDTYYVDRMRLILNFDIGNLTYDIYKVDNLKLNLEYYKDILSYRKCSLEAYKSKLIWDGTTTFLKATNKYNLNYDLNGEEISSLLDLLTPKKYIRGKVQATGKIDSFGTTESELIKNIITSGNIQVTNGELIEYANIIKPIGSLGKFINILGPKGNSNEFEYLKTNYEYKNNVFLWTNAKLKGIGVDGTAEGTIGLDKSINLKVTVGLSGILGNALKIPIIYKGEIGKNPPYVDPIWLGSVYAGTIILGGTQGTAVGGMAGSAASEYIDKAIQNIKSLWK